ncbi:MAG TPA: tripartite tricarboxylate transporter substrate binding protein [Burkholderiales bacterium]|nr:tripartite tricarboxylate transporter substrate binding protein [Burkholderiales bacterium]
MREIFPRVLCSACIAFGIAADAGAAEYPTRPVRLVVGFPPGGGVDTTARAVVPKLAERLGQHVVIDNRGGATGNVAAELVAKAPPDGYTVSIGSIAPLAVNPSLYENATVDPLRDFAPITRIGDSTNVLVVHPSVAATSVKELIALAQAKPGTLNAGSSGVAGAGHLALALFNVLARTNITHVPYKGGGPAMIDLLAGNIHLIFATTASAAAHMKSGRIRALAVTTAKRSALMPELPTVAEAGVRGFEANNWYGFVAPAKTPRNIIARLNRDMVAALSVPEVKEILFRNGVEVAPSTPEELGAYMRSEHDRWAKVIRSAGIKSH